MTTRETLNAIAAERIIILDGAMGSMIQTFNLGEADFRGSRFASHGTALLGCNDLLCLTKPEVIRSIHEAYLAAGADIIETCSFNSTSISLGDYGIPNLAYEISRAAAGLAREAADKFSTPEKPRFVAGSMGPTAKSACLSPDMNDPGKRGITWDELEAAYYENARGLLDGGADLLLIETVFDTLNAKAAIFAAGRLLEERAAGRPAAFPPSPIAAFPLMISATVSDAAGRLLSGQTVEAFYVSVSHASPWAVGLNCSFGAENLKPRIADLAATAPCLISAYPNAGLPNRFGGYDETPESMAAQLEAYTREGLVNILGGCCGSTPDHIAAIAARAENYPPRTIPALTPKTSLAGLEPLLVEKERGLTAIGERTNVAGSRKFLRLIRENKYRESLGMVREMIDQGASILNIGMDDPFLDAQGVMIRFLNLALSDPDIARVPLMIDSSRWEVILGALKCIQGKGLVNSISLKEGPEEFLRKSRLVRSYGAAVVVMLFDERGQAASYERKIEIARRAYDLLTGDGFPPEDIVFDPNVLAIATGMPEHDRYALDFIRTCGWITAHCPRAAVSAGVSNLSFSFRGHAPVRKAIHAVFLKHAAAAGLTMAIVDPGAMVSYDKIDPPLRQAVEDLILCREGTENPVERLLAMAVKEQAGGEQSGAGKNPDDSWRSLGPEERIGYAIVTGLDDYIEADILELRPKYARSLDLVEGPLMRGMREVGDRFSQGKLFLPQVIRGARVMKKAVAVLEPFIEQEKPPGAGRENDTVLLATVKGDVHDIGKNIVGVVLGCNGYRVLDLGVMIPSDEIISAAEKEGVRIIGLSGLISPSLEEMVRTARDMEKRGLAIPLLIGGAAASLAHTALRIAPEYSGPVVYVPDASRAAGAVRSLLSDTERPRFLEELEDRYREAARRHGAIQARIDLLPLEAARKNKAPPGALPPEPVHRGILELGDYPVSRVIPYIDWGGFLRSWEMGTPPVPGEEAEGARNKLLEDARRLLDAVVSGGVLELRGVLGFFPAAADGDDVILYDPMKTGGESPQKPAARFSFLRNQEKKRSGRPNPCLADFIAPGAWLGLFALSAGFGLPEAAAAYRARHDDYGALLLGSLANSLAEAFSEEIHRRVRREWWAYAPEEDLSAQEILRGTYQGIRPAFGYPACPDHEDKRIAFDLLGARKRCGLTLSESAMIIPAASVCGMFFSSPSAYYFGTGAAGEDQIRDWAARKGIDAGEARRRLGRI
jgi:5-methyltetrahydrofolate--homocysteine methyltransferase